MRLVAALGSGIFVAVAVGLLTGTVPTRLTRRPMSPRPVSARQQWMIQAGLEVTPRQFWLGSCLAGMAAFTLFVIITGVWTVALAPAVLVVSLPRLYFGRVRERRLTEVARAWPDGIRDLVASIASGASLSRAIEQMASTGPEPLRRAFARFGFLAKTMGVEAALEVIKEELSDPTTDRVIEVLILAHERGGTIVPGILRDLASATSRDIWTLEEIQTQALEQKINSRVVFVLPWMVLIAITLQDGAFREFYASSAGILVVFVGGLMSGFGIWMVSRLGRRPPEPRVFAGPDRTEPV